MKKPLKIFILLLSLLVLAIVSAAIILPLTFDPNDYKGEISDVVKTKTGLDLKITGGISVSFFPWIGFTAEQIALNSGTGMNERPLLTVAKADIKVKALPLLAKKIEIDHIELKGPHLFLERDLQGRGNWEALAERFEAEAPESPSNGSPQQHSDYLDDLSIGAVTIESAKVEWHDRQTGKHADINGVELHADAFGFNRPVKIDLSFTFAEDGGKYIDTAALVAELNVNDRLQRWLLTGLELHFARKSEQPGGRTWPALLTAPRIEYERADQSLTVKAARVKTYDAEISADFEVRDTAGSPVLQGTVKLLPFNPAKLMPQLGVKFPSMRAADALTSLAMKLKVTAEADRAVFERIDVNLDATHIEGEAEISDFSQPAAAFALQADFIDIDRYLSPKQAEKKALVTPAAALAAGLSRLPAKALAAIKATGELSVNKLKINSLTMQDVTLQLDNEKGNISVKQTAGRFYGGVYSGGMTMAVRENGAALTIAEKIKGARLDAMLDDAFGTARAAGKLDASYRLRGKAANGKVLKSSLSGRYDFFLKDGAIRGFNLEKAVDSGKSIVNGGLPVANGSNEKTEFSEISDTGAVDRGVLRSDDLVAQSSNFRIEGTGLADLNTEALDYRATVRVVKKKAAQDAPAQYYDTPAVVDIGGTFAKPTLTLDLAAFLTEKNKAKIKKLFDRNKKNINKLLRKLNKRFGAGAD